MDTVSDLLNRVKDDNYGKLGEWAEAMGLDHRYLERKLNINDPGAYLQVRELIPFIKATGDRRILHHIANRLEHVCILLPTSGQDPIELAKHIAEFTKEFSEALTATTQAWADGKITLDELSECRQQIYELMTVATALLKNLDMSAEK